MTTEKHLLIPKIEEGIVIDHIPAGLGVAILEMFHSYPGMEEIQLTLGLNYKSTKMGRKDMLKIFTPELPEKLLRHLSLLASGVTIKRIADFEVSGKYALQPPDAIEGLARCINPNCITNNERHLQTRFSRLGPETRKFRCAYCERVFELEELEIVLP